MFTTAIIFQYVYFIPQKANLFAITYFRVACYSINWIHNLRRHFVCKVSAVEIISFILLEEYNNDVSSANSLDKL
jgi:hypothetical protein